MTRRTDRHPSRKRSAARLTAWVKAGWLLAALVPAITQAYCDEPAEARSGRPVLPDSQAFTASSESRKQKPAGAFTLRPSLSPCCPKPKKLT